MSTSLIHKLVKIKIEKYKLKSRFYCDRDGGQGIIKKFKYKDSTKCPTKDELGLFQPVFTDRVCDGHRDCANGEDEDGTLGECIKDKLKISP